mmetsp:Transcript_44623/g.128033  ORF Transcript_44623/g.128033 Transcript_44623/m.128033 type:complete len:1114 (+) Transcript_44623:25-3366(+)
MALSKSCGSSRRSAVSGRSQCPWAKCLDPIDADDHRFRNGVDYDLSSQSSNWRHRGVIILIGVALSGRSQNLAFQFAPQISVDRASSARVTVVPSTRQRCEPDPSRRVRSLAPFAASSAFVIMRLSVKRRKKNRDGRRVEAKLDKQLRDCSGALNSAHDDAPDFLTSGAMPARYEFGETEEGLYQWWEREGFFKPEIADEISHRGRQQESYVIPMPPPNVTGRLHMGHAMFASLQDVLARFHRMYGQRTLWLPGMDHAGIATQMLVERQLVAEGKSRQAIGREAFLERVWDWKEEKGGAITEQLRRMGASCDWSREQFTLNDHMSGAVIQAFLKLHEKGLIFRGQRMVNWSPVLQTAVSDLEVEYSEQSGHLYYFKYVLVGPDGQPEDAFIPVATTRPETILGDSAVCVHPEDPRYQHFVGREVLVPIQGRKIPVIADSYVEREFGTGALKITPAHDFNDFEIAQRHNLSNHVVIALDGTMSKSVAGLGSPQYEGLERFECRKRLWEDLEAVGLAIRKEEHLQRVPLSQRSGEVIEPMLSDQWFVRTEDMAQRAMDAVESGEIRIQPERYTKIWRGWLEEKQPWCISRQLWWGHRIPVYYPTNRPEAEASGKYYVARSLEEALAQARPELGQDVELEQDPDVLDTWFSSGLWPFATVGWPDESGADFKAFYPATILETGYDILFFWVARMVMMGLALTDKAPFKEIYLHGLVRDDKGQKMSKTKGNVVDPLDSIAEYGTDALRFALLTSSVPGMDSPLSKGMLENAKAFTNKIWNVGRFIVTEMEKNKTVGSSSSSAYVVEQCFSQDDLASMPWIERALLSKAFGLAGSVTQSLMENKIAPPTKALKEFLQEDFAAWYIEVSKTRLQPSLGGDPGSERGSIAQRVLLYTLGLTLRLLQPFMPFLTEAVWQRLPHKPSCPGSLMITPWWDSQEGGAVARDEEAETWFAKMCTVITQIRNVKAQYEIPPKDRGPLTIWCRDEGLCSALQAEISVIAWLARADAAQLKVDSFGRKGGETPSGVVRTVVSEELEFDMPIPEKSVDIGKEEARLQNQLQEITNQLETTAKKVTPSFLEKANPQAREKILKKKTELEQTQAAVAQQLAELKKSAQELVG